MQQLLTVGAGDQSVNASQEIDRFISDVRRLSAGDQGGEAGRFVNDGVQAHCSTGPVPSQPQVMMPQLSKAEIMIRDAEASRARVLDVPGTLIGQNPDQMVSAEGGLIGLHFSGNRASVLADEDYFIVGNHLDDNIKRKIGNGEYVDFSKLLPKDKVGMEEDHRMEIVNRGGMTYWVPVSDCEGLNVNNFNKWEQAFRVYMNVYTYFHPSRAGEMIQCNHIIHTAAQSFAWDNVYRYDREFQLHMSWHHLNRSWAVILQQAWSMCLKDKIYHSSPNYSFNASGGANKNAGHGGGGPRR